MADVVMEARRRIVRVRTMSAASDWVERNVRCTHPGFTITDDQARCVDVISSIDTGPHNVYTLGGWGPANFPRSGGVEVWLRHDLATYDSSQLTALVVAAHRHHVRVSVSAELMPAGLADSASEWLDASEIDEAEAWLSAYTNGEIGHLDPDEFTGPTTTVLAVRLHPRHAAELGDHLYRRHPSLADLAARCTR